MQSRVHRWRGLLGWSAAAVALLGAAGPALASDASASRSPQAAQVVDPGPLVLTDTGEAPEPSADLTCTTQSGRVLLGSAEIERRLASNTTLDCTFTQSDLGTAVAQRGTLTSAVGRAEATGRFSATCDVDRAVRATWRQTGAAGAVRVSGLTWTVAGYQSCDWGAAFDDGSRLVGAIEDVTPGQTVTVGEVAAGRATLESLQAMPVSITGGDGRFRDVIGTALLLEARQTTVAFPGATGPGESIARVRAPSNVTSSTSGTAPVPASAGGPRRSLLTELRLLRSAGGVRVVSPAAQLVGQQYGVRPLATAPTVRPPEIRIVTTPGATCSVAVRPRRPQARFIPLATSVVATGRWQTGILAEDVALAAGAPADGIVDLKVDCALADSTTVSSEIRVGLGMPPARPL